MDTTREAYKRKLARQRAYRRERYANDEGFRQRQCQHVKKYRNAYIGGLKELVAEFKKDGCVFCGEKEPVCLAAHHVDPKLKKEAVAGTSTEKALRPPLLKN